MGRFAYRELPMPFGPPAGANGNGMVVLNLTSEFPFYFYLFNDYITDEDFVVPINYPVANLEEHKITLCARKPQTCSRADCTTSKKHPYFLRFNLHPYKPHTRSELIFPPGLIQTRVRNVKWSSHINRYFFSLYTSLQVPDIFYLGKKKTRALIRQVSSRMQSLRMEVWPHGQYQLQRRKHS